MSDGRPASKPDRALEGAIARTRRDQARAADPEASAWVSANAGTGKTFVLVRRVLRLLLAGSEPSRILCLTYTKAAAAEMANRLFDQLAHWATASADELHRALADMLDRAPRPKELALARTLFALAIETPGGLKVQTIHAFCERLLKRFPLEAGISPHFTVLDEETSRALTRSAIDAVLTEATGPRAGGLGEALASVIAHRGDESFDELIGEAMKRRGELSALITAESTADDPFEHIETRLRRSLGLGPDTNDAGLVAAMTGVLPEATMRRMASSLEDGGKQDNDHARRLRAALAAPSDEARVEALTAVFLTKDGEVRSTTRYGTAAVLAAHPDIRDTFSHAADHFAALRQQRLALRLTRASIALLRITDAVLQRFDEAKAERAALDYDDLILGTERLLRLSGQAQWVLYKLDNGLDHILVDEAQDTSPVQWRIIESLAQEFFAGHGSADVPRTVFAVGDEKQSIYGFQGAAPEMFSQMGNHFAAETAAVGARHHRVPLDLSFRTVSPVLDAIDRVFAEPARAAGLTAAGEAIRHIARRAGHGGLVEIWPTERPSDPIAAEPFSPLEDQGVATPMALLAGRIARQIETWLKGSERLVSEGRPVKPGDILILVRKRQPFAPIMITALKALGIPVAGSDRIRVTEHIGVEDLAALGQFVLLPEDDLSLACVLKSPLIGLDDDDLFAIGHGRRGSLWAALLGKAGTRPAFGEAAETLKRWRSRADLLPPFEFYAGLIEREGRRKDFLARLGPEAGDAIDEFLNLAIRYDAQFPPSLQGFLDWLRQGSPEIRRDMDQGRDEVRVMTVHGAKGLEAPIVFLPDTCSVRSSSNNRSVVTIGDAGVDGLPGPLAWVLKGASGMPAVAEARARAGEADRHEFHRLLYVAMTRARDRLYVAGFEGTRGREPGCWYNLIRDGLEGIAQEAEADDGYQVWRLSSPQEAAPELPRRRVGGAEGSSPLPAWALQPAPREPARAIPLAPSKLAPLETEEGTGLAASQEPASPPPPGLAGANRFLRGTLTHALLQHLPEIAPQKRKGAAERFLKAQAADLPARTRSSIVSETMTILEDAAFAPLFGPGSEAEVPISGEISGPGGRTVLRVSGQIDRLLATPNELLIVDYKTNRPPPVAREAAPRAYLLQLAAYRLVLQRIYGPRPMRAALLWTDGPRLMAIPGEMLDACESDLFVEEPDRV